MSLTEAKQSIALVALFRETNGSNARVGAESYYICLVCLITDLE